MALDAILDQVSRLDVLLRDLLNMTHRPPPQSRPVEVPRYPEDCLDGHLELAALL